MTKRAMLLEALASTIPDLNRLAATFNAHPNGAAAVDCRQGAIELLQQLALEDLALRARLADLLQVNSPDLVGEGAQATPLESSNSPAAAAEWFAVCRLGTLAFLRGLRPGDWQRATHDAAGNSHTVRFLVQDLVANDIAASNQLVTLSIAYHAAGRESMPSQQRAAP